MFNFINVLLDFMTQFAGGRGGIDHNVVQFGIAAIFWGVLMVFAYERRREDDPPRERLLLPAFALGLTREVLMFCLATVLALGWIDHDLLHTIFPPLEHALVNGAVFFIAGAFLLFLLERPALAHRYLRWSLASLLACYLATFWWWAIYIKTNPASRFGQTWCDWLFRLNACLWLAIAMILMAQARRGWLRRAVRTTLLLFFLTEALKIIDMALGETYEHIFTPIRHSCYLLGIFLLSVIYLREQLQERRENRAMILELAYHDNLTGLPNRALFHDRLHQALARASRTKSSAAILFLDLDRFKTINDTRGHASGDKLLRSVANRLKCSLREGDTLARLGGDEFVILLPGIVDAGDAVTVAEKVMELMARPFSCDGHEILTSASLGLALYPEDGSSGEELLKHADIAMYAAKDQGRACYQLFSDKMQRQVTARHHLENGLRRAIKEEEFQLHYQPQVDLGSGRVVGVEALLRWQHPAMGMVFPDQFIPVAEETGMIRAIDEWVLRSACSQAMSWQTEGLPPMRMAVNISASQFNHDNFIGMIDRILVETGYNGHLLELEVTEGMLMADGPKSAMILNALKIRGVLLTIDDFGTGHSSLSYLKHFPVNRIKIDKSFVRDVVTNRDDAAIVTAIITMAGSLNLAVIAEGVENHEQLAFLRDLHCLEVQGYYLGRPTPPEDIPWRLTEQSTRAIDFPFTQLNATQSLT